MKIGILALQGAVIEHENHLKKLNCSTVLVKRPKDLHNIDGIILPGGESTTMGKLLKDTNLLDPLKDNIKSGLPVWGTCAGMILLAKEIENDDKTHLSLMNIKVKRNAYGSQLDSFAQHAIIPEISSDELPVVFIRAPFITEAKDNVRILLKVNDNIVAAREKNIFVTSFHPELTECSDFHKYFLSMCDEYKQ